MKMINISKKKALVFSTITSYLLFYILVGGIPFLLNPTGDLGGVIYNLVGAAIWVVFVIPIMSFGYSKRFLVNQSDRLFILYNSLLIASPIIIVHVLIFLVVTAWSFLWGWLGLMRRKKSEEKPETVSAQD